MHLSPAHGCTRERAGVCAELNGCNTGHLD
jgi:hypothetical protein